MMNRCGLCKRNMFDRQGQTLTLDHSSMLICLKCVSAFGEWKRAQEQSREYVMALMFSGDKVLLQQNEDGFLNGIGCLFRTPLNKDQVIKNHFEHLTRIHWKCGRHFLTLNRPDRKVYVYRNTGPIHEVENSEKYTICSIHELPSNITTDMSWIIPLAHQSGNVDYFTEFFDEVDLVSV